MQATRFTCLVSTRVEFITHIGLPTLGYPSQRTVVSPRRRPQQAPTNGPRHSMGLPEDAWSSNSSTQQSAPRYIVNNTAYCDCWSPAPVACANRQPRHTLPRSTVIRSPFSRPWVRFCLPCLAVGVPLHRCTYSASQCLELCSTYSASPCLELCTADGDTTQCSASWPTDVHYHAHLSHYFVDIVSRR